MTSVPLDRIAVATRQSDVLRWLAAAARVLVLVVGSVLYGLGWSARTVVTAVWFVATWCAAAVRLGWSDAAG
ncbi:hypothetical protein ACWCHM_26095 [Micromonospora sp. SCSIO 07396]